MNISQKINHQDKIGTALRYSNPKRGWFGRKSSGKKLYIEAEALEYLLNLNDYDQLQVCNDHLRLDLKTGWLVRVRLGLKRVQTYMV